MGKLLFDSKKIIDWLPGMDPQPGEIYSRMPIEVYHGEICGAYISHSSLIKVFDDYEDFETAWKSYDDLDRKTKPMEVGFAFHDHMEFLHCGMKPMPIIVSQTDGIPSKKWKAQKVANPGRPVLPKKEIEHVRRMVRTVWKKGARLNTFFNVWPELSLFWKDSETGLLMKARPDITRFDVRLFGEYKTTKERSKDAFSRTIFNRHYDLQIAMQAEGLQQTTGIDFLLESGGALGYALFLTVTNSPPIRARFYPVFRRVIETGARKYRNALELVKAGAPGDQYEYIDLPEWAHRQVDFDESY